MEATLLGPESSPGWLEVIARIGAAAVLVFVLALLIGFLLSVLFGSVECPREGVSRLVLSSIRLPGVGEVSEGGEADATSCRVDPEVAR